MRSTLEQAVQSVFAQTSPHWELLILDDGSYDGTWDYLKTLPITVRCFRNAKRQGVPRCRNRLLNEARGEFVSVLDADDAFYSEKVKRHGTILASHPTVGVVWGRALVESKDDPSPRLLPAPGFVPGWDLATPYQIIHSATTWRRSALLAVGGYDETLFCEEAPDAFLKVGDRFEQKFDEAVCAVKRLAQGTAFRNYWKSNQRAITASLLLKTLSRRYGNIEGPLQKRLRDRQATFRI